MRPLYWNEVFAAAGSIVVIDLLLAGDNAVVIAMAVRGLPAERRRIGIVLGHGNLALLSFGLALSIPFIVFTSDLLSRLMNRYPVIVYGGAAILGKVAAEMMLTDPATEALFHPGRRLVYGTEAVFAAAIVELEDAPDCLREVAADPGGITVASMSMAVEGVRAVAIDGVEPSAAQVRAGVYALGRPMYLVARAPASPEADALLDVALSAAGQAIVGKKFTPAR